MGRPGFLWPPRETATASLLDATALQPTVKRAERLIVLNRNRDLKECD